MRTLIDHIKITVNDMAQAEPLYDQFSATVGFDISKKVRAIIFLKRLLVDNILKTKRALSII